MVSASRSCKAKEGQTYGEGRERGRERRAGVLRFGLLWPFGKKVTILKDFISKIDEIFSICRSFTILWWFVFLWKIWGSFYDFLNADQNLHVRICSWLADPYQIISDPNRPIGAVHPYLPHTWANKFHSQREHSWLCTHQISVHWYSAMNSKWKRRRFILMPEDVSSPVRRVLRQLHVLAFKFQSLQQRATAIENLWERRNFETEIETFFGNFEKRIHFWLDGKKLYSHRYPSVKLKLPSIFMV